MEHSGAWSTGASVMRDAWPAQATVSGLREAKGLPGDGGPREECHSEAEGPPGCERSWQPPFLQTRLPREPQTPNVKESIC